VADGTGRGGEWLRAGHHAHVAVGAAVERAERVSAGEQAMLDRVREAVAT